MQREPDVRKRLYAAIAECSALKEEVRQLKELLARTSVALPSAQPIPSPGFLPTLMEIVQTVAPSAKEDRVALFRSLFRETTSTARASPPYNLHADPTRSFPSILLWYSDATRLKGNAPSAP
jgi:hypothetical protein